MGLEGSHREQGGVGEVWGMGRIGNQGRGVGHRGQGEGGIGNKGWGVGERVA